MSYGSSSPGRRRFGGGTLLIALLALVAIGTTGRLVWRPAGGTDGAGAASAAAGRSPGQRSEQRQQQEPDGLPGDRDRTGPLTGRVLVLDPGHNPGNRRHPREIARQVDAGTHRKECDTTGTSTDSGYAEAAFTLDVSRRVRTLLRHRGAVVKFTQDADRPYGPCVDERARIGNKAHADAVVSVHADGAAAGDRGFHVILPASVRTGSADTSAIAGPSRDLGRRIAEHFARATGSSPSNYRGDGRGLDVRSDLGGLNLSRVPKVFLECGNMRDPQDAARLTSAAWRQRAAEGIAYGIEDFLAP